MRRRAYAADGQRAVANPTKTAIGVAAPSASPTTRPWIFDAWFSSSATPADNSIEWLGQRFTTVGTGSSVTPTALDPADPAATSQVAINHSVEPGYTANAILWHAAPNQRSLVRMQLDPDAPFVIPATANNGIGFQPINSAATPTVDFIVYFAE